MTDQSAYYVVQSAQVRGEPRLYWIEKREPNKPRMGRCVNCIEDFGTNRRKAERRCAELNNTTLTASQST